MHVSSFKSCASVVQNAKDAAKQFVKVCMHVQTALVTFIA